MSGDEEKSVYTLLCDGFDREVAAELLERDASLQRQLERAKRLLPRAEHLYQDLFSILFKMNIVQLPSEQLAPSVLVHRRLTAAVLKSPALKALRARTQLDAEATRTVMYVLGERVLAVLTRDNRVVAQDLLEMADVADDEDREQARQLEREALNDLPEGTMSDEERAQVAEAVDAEIAALKARIEEGRKTQTELAEGLPLDLDVDLNAEVQRLPERLEEIDSQMQAFGIGPGGEGRTDASRRLELGERLLASKKLQLLARLLGAFREVAFEARRKRIVRAPQELHEVERGRQLERLLPSELVGFRARARPLRLDFLRRWVEGDLLQYRLEGAAERGPMVVCVDGSGSMHGSRELWAKAVALTLMEIARRERRRFLGIIFSSGHQLFEVELLDRSKRSGGWSEIRHEEVLEFAEHFPGGGTNFEEPLGRAVEAVSEGSYRRGDIVFITDGAAPISEAFVQDLEARKRKSRFTVRGILVGGRHAQRETLARIADDVRTVEDLTADSMSDVFAAV